MIAGILGLGAFTAVLTTSFLASGPLQYLKLNTLEEIKSQLQKDGNQRMCVVKGTYVALRVASLDFSASVITGESLEDCYMRLEEGQVWLITAIMSNSCPQSAPPFAYSSHAMMRCRQ